VRRRKQRDTEIAGMSFLDAICCGFGAVILLLVIVKIREPGLLEGVAEELIQSVAHLSTVMEDLTHQDAEIDEELEEINRELAMASSREAALRKELEQQKAALKGLVKEEDFAEAIQRTLATRPEPLTGPFESDAIVGGIPADSRYIIFIIDTSGSMHKFSWSKMLGKMSEILEAYPQVEGIQVMNDMGKYMFTSFARGWIPDTPNGRRLILNYLKTWAPFSNSSPVEGITKAIQTYTPRYRDISIYVLGDEFTGSSIQDVVDTVDQLNADDVVRIHGVGFPFKGEHGELYSTVHRFGTLMRVLTQRNGGTFVALGKES
jgi:hypothetical protein